MPLHPLQQRTLKWLMGGCDRADETKAKLMAVGKKTLHFTCSNFPALVMLPLAAWTYVSVLSTPAFTQPQLCDVHRCLVGP